MQMNVNREKQNPRINISREQEKQKEQTLGLLWMCGGHAVHHVGSM